MSTFYSVGYLYANSGESAGTQTGVAVLDPKNTIQAVLWFRDTPYGKEGALAREKAEIAMQNLADLMNAETVSA